MFEIVNGRRTDVGGMVLYKLTLKAQVSSGELIKDTGEASKMKAYLLLYFSRLKATPEMLFSSLIPSVARQHIFIILLSVHFAKSLKKNAA